MDKKFFWGFVMTGLGFFVGCGTPEAPPPGDPAMDNIEGESAYEVPADSAEGS